MEQPLINIITRTRNRPGFFKVCVDSLNLQSYKNVHHIVTYQVDKDLEYINKYKFKNTTLVKVPNILKDKTLSTTIEGNHLNHSPYNEFLNLAHKSIEKGWVMYLDDDDILTYSNTLEKLISNINQYDIDTKHMWKVQFPGYTIPNNLMFTKYLNGEPLKICQISMIGLLYHSKHLDKVNFHKWACGDFFAFQSLDKNLPKRNMINHPLTRIQTTPGNGFINDI